MSEFRQDRTNDRWVVIAPERARRPGGSAWKVACEATRAFDPDCPFCPGNEQRLRGTIEETASDRPPGWRVRVVPNKYPILSPSPAAQGSGASLHEVIIETPAHDGDLTTLSGADFEAAVQTYRRRFAALRTMPGVETVLLFRNHGRQAGASLVHPHAQIVACGTVPPRLAAADAWAAAHYARRQGCLVCEEVTRELDDGQRVIDRSERYLVVVPYAAASPCEQWLLPRRHEPSFGEVEADGVAELAVLLQRALRRLKAALDDPPYNFVVEPGLSRGGDARWAHWSLRIVPALTTPGGFELGAGLPVNPSRPEDDAQDLRRLAAMAVTG